MPDADDLMKNYASKATHDIPPIQRELAKELGVEDDQEKVEVTQGQFTGQSGVYDFDGALFRTLWEGRPLKDFLAYMRYYVSDHRPLWAEFSI